MKHEFVTQTNSWDKFRPAVTYHGQIISKTIEISILFQAIALAALDSLTHDDHTKGPGEPNAGIMQVLELKSGSWKGQAAAVISHRHIQVLVA